MANKQILIPFLNPVKYHELTPTQIPQYLSKQMEKFPFNETILPWEQYIEFAQLWQTSDLIEQHIISELGPITMEIIDCAGNIYHTEGIDQKFQNKQNAAQWIYENETALSDLEDGIYFIKLIIGTSSPTLLISEPQFICDSIPGSLYLEYNHRSYYGDVFFESGITFKSRVLGTLKLKTPASKDTIYEDQPLNETLIWSYPYDVYELTVGSSNGIPDYLIKRLNRVFGCDSLSIDGILYTKNEGAKWQEKAEENYPMRAWSIELREALGGRASQVYENGTYLNKQASQIVAIDTHGFSESQTGGEISIIDID